MRVPIFLALLLCISDGALAQTLRPVTVAVVQGSRSAPHNLALREPTQKVIKALSRKKSIRIATAITEAQIEVRY